MIIILMVNVIIKKNMTLLFTLHLMQTFADLNAGCLMILAWIFFASIGLLLTKYYKPMWPESRMFDHKYWFLVSDPSFLARLTYSVKQIQ